MSVWNDEIRMKELTVVATVSGRYRVQTYLVGVSWSSLVVVVAAEKFEEKSTKRFKVVCGTLAISRVPCMGRMSEALRQTQPFVSVEHNSINSMFRIN